MAEKQSQSAQIRKYLEEGNSITPLEALDMFGCWRLGARIADIKKQGLDIRTDIVEDPTSGKRYARYSLVEHSEPCLPVFQDGAFW